jgi:predicted acylesterase/phospholipase RssA
MAFPGIFAPIYDEGSVLIDGGAINNLPVDRMRAMCPTGTVIGVDLVTSSSVSGEYDFGPSLSGWQALLGRQVKAPNLLNIVGGLVENANRYHLNEVWRCADLLIKVPVQEFGLLEFDKHARIMQAGYLAAGKQIKEFQS